MLAEHNLETPGYAEAVKNTNALTAEKKRLRDLGHKPGRKNPVRKPKK